MKKRKKKTAEEMRAWREAREARVRELEYWIERGKAELAARRAARPDGQS